MAFIGLKDSNRGNASDFIGECTVTQCCEPCMKTNTSKAAVIFCKDCHEFLCETCRNPHIAYKPGPHGIVSIQERESSQVVVDMKGMDRCKEHGKGFDFFCEDHSKLCCTSCVITHRKCDTLDEIASISLQKGFEIYTLKQFLLKLESDVDANVIECQQLEKQLNESIIDISKEVDDLGDQLIHKIEEAKREFRIRANDLKSEEIKRLNDKHALNTQIKEEINEIFPIFSAISKQGTCQQMYILSKQIEEQFKKIGSSINDKKQTTQYSTKVIFSFPRELSSLLEMGNDLIKVNLERSVQTKLDILAAPATHAPVPVDHGHDKLDPDVYKPEATTALRPIQQTPEKGMTCIAVFDYEAADDGEITFKSDDVIIDAKQIDENWWEGTAPDGSQGMFPSNHVEVCRGVMDMLRIFQGTH